MTFRFRPALTAATFIALLILCSLGAWQLQRLDWKKALIAKTEARIASATMPLEEALARAERGEDMEYQPVVASGAWRGGAAHVFAAHEGRAGVLVFAPFETGGRVIYVNRGFSPQDEVATLPEAAGPARVEGLFRTPEAKGGFERLLAPKDQPADNLYFTRDPRRFAGAAGLGADGFYIDSFDEPRSALWPKGGLTRLEFSNRHLEYALTWFGLAGALLGVYLAFSLRRG